MRDIGALDTRITNLEYYTSLSLLEQDAINMQDSTTSFSANLQRFKNGIVVDSFKGHSVADVTAIDYKSSIDIRAQELRPTFNITSRMLNFDASNSSSYLQTGPFVTASASNTAFVDQKLASRIMNINPFNVVNYLGKIQLNPPSDIWVDTSKKPDVLVNIGGDKDAWDLILQATNASPFTYEWGSWETVWSGTTQSTQFIGDGGFVRPNFNRTTTTTTSAQTRSGILSQVAPQTITQSIGDRVVDVSVIPYMRDRAVAFSASDFKPDTILYSFFDGTAVEKYVARANKFILASNNLSYNVNLTEAETLNVVNATTSTTNATCIGVKTSNNAIFVLNLDLKASAVKLGANLNLVGTKNIQTLV
jgi:hypothetical protein